MPVGAKKATITSLKKEWEVLKQLDQHTPSARLGILNAIQFDPDSKRTTLQHTTRAIEALRDTVLSLPYNMILHSPLHFPTVVDDPPGRSIHMRSYHQHLQPMDPPEQWCLVWVKVTMDNLESVHRYASEHQLQVVWPSAVTSRQYELGTKLLLCSPNVYRVLYPPPLTGKEILASRQQQRTLTELEAEEKKERGTKRKQLLLSNYLTPETSGVAASLPPPPTKKAKETTTTTTKKKNITSKGQSGVSKTQRSAFGFGEHYSKASATTNDEYYINEDIPLLTDKGVEHKGFVYSKF